MKRLALVFVVICAAGVCAVDASAASWRGITPMRSTRADVERLLGEPVSWSYTVARHELDDLEVRIDYLPNRENYMFDDEDLRSMGLACAVGIPDNTVLKIEITPMRSMLLSDFGLALKNFEPVEGCDGADRTCRGFKDARAGIVFHLDEESMVEWIAFVPSEGDRAGCDDYFDEVEARAAVSDPGPIYCPPVPVCVAIVGGPDVFIGDSIALSVNATDVDGDVLTYTWSSTCGRIVGSGANVTFDATGVPEGTCTITVQISDGFNPPVECTALVVNVHAP